MEKNITQGNTPLKIIVALGALLLIFILSGCTSSKEKYNKGYEDGLDDASDSVDYRNKSYSAGYDEGYTSCEKKIERQY